MKRRIFIGSSTEGLDAAQQVAALLTAGGETEAVMWPDIFQPGLLTFEALENVLLRCCAAVFVATPDDQMTIRGQEVRTARTNIMLEFGLVAGRIGRQNIALCLFGGVELPSDLQGLTVIDMCAGEHECRLRQWTSGLLATTDQIARTDIHHGYSGRWDFSLQLNHWRGRELHLPSYAFVNGTLDLIIAANGQAGKGFAQGHVLFKLVAGADTQHTFQGDYRTAHEITSADCNSDGSLRFTSQAFAVGKMNTTGVAPPELSGLDLTEPWSAQWQLHPSGEPRVLEGTVTTGTFIGTTGAVKVTKC